MPSLTIELDPKSPLHRRILDACRDRIDASRQAYQSKYSQWRKNEEAAVAYLPERDVDAVRRVKRDAGSPQYTTIQVPYSYAMLMAAHTYWTTIFMARTPVLQYSGRHGESSQNVQALEALMDYQVQIGEMLAPFYVWLYDVGKFGVGVMGLYWDQRFSNVSEVVEKEELLFNMIPTGRVTKKKVTRRVKGYQGNCVYNIRPYDVFPDPRVTLGEFQKGEFCGVYRRIGWNALLKRKELGYYTNLERVRPSREPPDSSRTEGSPVIDLPDSGTMFYTQNSQGGMKETAVIPLYEVYIELVPSEWGLGNSSYPEKWVFTCDAEFKTVIGAQPLGANHDRFPLVIIVLEPEGYALAPRGMPEILQPVQNTLDWLINSHFYNVRKILNGQFVVDPSRIAVSDMLDPTPGGVIRAKPAGYGTDLNSAVHQLQTVDVTQQHMKDMQIMQQIGEQAVGINAQIMGQMNSGRRTATEIRTASTFGISRLKTCAELFSAQGWAPLSQMMVSNTQQYYDQSQQFKIAGDLMQSASPGFVQVTPEDILGFYDYVPVDGTLPIDRFAQANLWREIMAGLQQQPQLMMQYDMGKLFAWVAQLAGLKNINQFKLQVTPDQVLAQQMQAGNVVPAGGTPAGGAEDLTRVPEPGQVSGLGTTG
jgi:hypothetical protein